MSDSRTPADHAVRREVIEPGASYIVQAPAGSGKTELLTQRFLRLLSGVDQPQKVLAITFTRKATREMADRVLERLRGAAAGTIPSEPHQRLAHELALEVLKRDAAEGWNLLDNPGLLQVHTIDGLCARLAARGSGAPQALGSLQVVEFPAAVYTEAARLTLVEAARAGEDDDIRRALEALLLRERGNANALQALLADALPRRDQWLPIMEGRAVDTAPLLSLRQRLEITVLEHTLGREAIHAAGQAVVQLAALADAPDPDDPLPVAWSTMGEADDPAHTARAYWYLFKRLSSSSSQPWSARSVNSRVYPGPASGRAEGVQALGEIVTAWREDPEALVLFSRFLKAPPLNLDADADALMGALRALLLRARDQLHALFAEQGVCDFQHVAAQALDALGRDGTPGEALLIEDGRLEHVLIDEFQDTSQLQYELVRRLVAGWTPGEGRSLFLVGDPMQSIYRFRKADVGLFQAVFRAERLGQVPLAARRLSDNFRSSATVIDEVNRVCADVFAPPSPAAPGHVDYTAVQPFHGPGGQVHYQAVIEDDGRGGAIREAAWISERIGRFLDEADSDLPSVGVLARKRSQLEPIAAALTDRGIAYEAVEVQSLARRPLVLDLLTLTRAVLHPGDRVAWLGLLLAPWCALQADELMQLAGMDNAADMLSRMSDVRLLEGLSAGSRQRVEVLASSLKAAHQTASEAELAVRVEAAWVRLGGPRMARSRQDLADAEVFLRLLTRLESERPEDFLAELDLRLQRLYAGSRSASVKLMTVHKAKGLEFDAVFLPALQGGTGNHGRSLFRAQDVAPGPDGEGALVAPLKPSGKGDPGLYDYLGLLDREAQDCESHRLLYVAMTRARRFLQMSAVCALKKDGGIARKPGSFLALLEPQFEKALANADHPPETQSASCAVEPRPLLRLPEASPRLAPKSSIVRQDAPVTLGEPFPDRDRLALGEALHHWLELIHDHWDERWLGDWTAGHAEALRSSLSLFGARNSSLDALHAELAGLLESLLADEAVRDMLSPEGKARSLAEAEYFVPVGQRLRRQIIDRLYQDRDGDWHVVDYKSGADASETRSKWRDQLGAYAATVASAESATVVEARILQAGEARFIDPATDEIEIPDATD